MSRRCLPHTSNRSAIILRLLWAVATVARPWGCCARARGSEIASQALACIVTTIAALCVSFGFSANDACATDAVPASPALPAAVRDVPSHKAAGLELKDASSPILAHPVPCPTICSQLWAVSTRCLTAEDACRGRFVPQVSRFECNCGWIDSSWEEFQAADDPRRVTTIFIDGNGTDERRADRDGRAVYRLLAQSACSRQPVRFVIWDWPADRVRGTLRYDAQVKACRTSVEAYFVAHFVNLLDPEARVSILGYSFGARVTAGALHILAGGDLDGRRLRERQLRDRSSMHTVLLAPALDNYWLLPGNRNGLALSQVDRLLMTFNPCDRVLQFYPVLSCGPEALGYTGFAGVSQLGPDRERLWQMNISGIVGKRHDSYEAFESPAIMARFRSVLLFEK